MDPEIQKRIATLLRDPNPGNLPPPETSPYGMAYGAVTGHEQDPGLRGIMSKLFSQILPPPTNSPMQFMGAAGTLKYDAKGNPIGYAEPYSQRPMTTGRLEAAVAEARKREAAGEGALFPSVGFRNWGTGEVIKGGPTHFGSEHLLPQEQQGHGHILERWFEPGTPKFEDLRQQMGITDMNKAWEPGFMTHSGRFLTRQQAAHMGKGYFRARGLAIPDTLNTDSLEALSAGMEGLMPHYDITQDPNPFRTAARSEK